MYDIYSRLLAGEDLDAIMTQFTEEANAAQKRYDETKAAEIAFKKEREAAKHETMVDIINSALYFIAEFYPTLGYTTEDVDAIDDATIHAMADLAIGVLDLEAVKAGMPKQNHVKLNINLPFRDKEIKPAPENAQARTTDDVFADFFKSLGI